MALLIWTALVPGTARAQAAAPAQGSPDAPLYVAFGKQAGIAAIVDDFVDRVVKDPRVNKRFEGMNTKHFKEMSTQQFCMATGGPCAYQGKDMRTAHIGMHITDAEYDAVTEDLVATLDNRGVPKDAQHTFLAKREKHRASIVTTSASVNQPVASSGAVAAPAGPPSPTLLRVQDFQDAAHVLEMADSARVRGNMSLASKLFYSVELLVGTEALAELHATYSAGAPPLVQSPLTRMPAHTPRQPRIVRDQDEPQPVHEARESHGGASGPISGTLTFAGKRVSDGIGLVTLRPLDRQARSRAPQTRTMEQRERDFAPHFLVVPVGSTVSFPNFDPIYHNVYSSSEAKAFDLGVYRNGESRDVRFDKPGIVRIECGVHDNMIAYIAVVSEPYTALVEGGQFELRSVPPGRYLLRAWTEHSGKTTEKEIVIAAGNRVLAVEVDGRANDRARTDKFGNPRS